MTLFDHPDGVAPADDGREEEPIAATVKRPSRYSVRNWSVRWKVLAIALLPMALAALFGGLRVSNAITEANRLRLVADRAEMIPTITNYMSALGNALVAVSSDGDAQGAKKNFENRKFELQSRVSHTAVATDVQSGVGTLLEHGQQLLDVAFAGGIGLRDEVTSYAPLLLTAEDAINGSVRVDSERIRAQTEGLSRAVGARGQMLMQELLVNRGGEIPDPELRTSMMTLAGTEPSTLFGMSEVLGVDSPDAKNLQLQMVTRMGVMSNPENVLPNNPMLLDSIRITDQIAARVISENSGSITAALEDRAANRRAAAIRDGALVLGTLVTVLLVVGLVARSLVRPLRTLRDSALRVAHTDLEDEIARVRAGDERPPAPLPVFTTEEVGQVAHAVDELHAQALLLAGDEARLRRLVNEMFETMSRRNRSLVDQQLALIDRLERNEDDPDRLESLFRLDHLAARMRRNGANLLVLAGSRMPQERARSVPLATVISAATAEVEGYHRVQTVLVPEATVLGAAATDTVHLLAELIDNGLRYSAPTASVRVVAGFEADGGVVIEVVDAGLGMTETDLRMANMRLAAGGEFSPENARHMGLFVISLLAHRHGIEVRLFPAEQGGQGVTAEVYLPPDLLTGAPVVERPAAPPVAPPPPPPPVSQWSAPAVPIDEPEFDLQPEPEHYDDSSPGPVVSLLPRRTPGSSGITGVPAALEPEPEPAPEPVAEPPRVRRELPRPWWETGAESADGAPEPAVEKPAPGDTSAYFAARYRVEPDEVAELVRADLANVHLPDDHLPDDAARPDHAADRGPNTDVIYQRMLSESLGGEATSQLRADLDWKTVWDRGWSVAAEVEHVPVIAHTEHGLPVREPGVRLVPGSAVETGEPAEAPEPPDKPAAPARHEADSAEPVASNGVPHRPAHATPERDPDAVRASISSHFGGVRAGRAQARDDDRNGFDSDISNGPDTDRGQKHR